MNKESSIRLSLQQLSIGYAKNNPVLQNINIELKSGTLTALIANNGVGKSTLLKTLAGSLPYLAGKIAINENDINSFSQIDLAKKIAIVLTEKPQLAGFTVYDLVSMGRFPHTNVFGALGDKDKDVIQSSIIRCGIENLQQKKCNEISDGEFQKAMIARALAQETDVLLLDEPSAFLDYSSKRKLFELLKNIAENEQKIVLVSSHDLEVLHAFSHHFFIIKNKEQHPVRNTREIAITELPFLLNSD